MQIGNLSPLYTRIYLTVALIFKHFQILTHNKYHFKLFLSCLCCPFLLDSEMLRSGSKVYFNIPVAKCKVISIKWELL
jgi:hypothetical protein